MEGPIGDYVKYQQYVANSDPPLRLPLNQVNKSEVKISFALRTAGSSQALFKLDSLCSLQGCLPGDCLPFSWGNSKWRLIGGVELVVGLVDQSV